MKNSKEAGGSKQGQGIFCVILQQRRRFFGNVQITAAGEDGLGQRRTGKELMLTPEQETAYTTVGGTPHLDGEYTVFGEVIAGLDVVESIQRVECDVNDRPLEDVRILKTEIIK